MAGKKKALYTYLCVKELEAIKIIVADRVEREAIIHDNTKYNEASLLTVQMRQKALIKGLQHLLYRIECVRVKTCFVDEEYKKEVENGQYN